jgi:mevalonate kinase
MTTIQVPGKLILSGEHAVVYGMPALAVAINRFVNTQVQPQINPVVQFNFPDLAYENSLALNNLEKLQQQLKKKYQSFIDGDLSIADVLQHPVELGQFAVGLLFTKFSLQLTHGVKINLQSDVPVGCGMGSSAAAVLGIIKGVALQLNLELMPEDYFALALQAENMLHGNSSGLDLKICLNGGCHLWDKNKLTPQILPTLPFYLVNTGTPLTHTGECVAAAKKYFINSAIGDDFAAVTQAMATALQQNDLVTLCQTIQANQQLLVNIGVVPQRTQAFIAEIENTGGAAKVCGAGAVAGNNAGIVWVVPRELAQLKKLCAKYQYEILTAQAESRGVHVN